jgi:hypothetical protein
LKGIPDNLSLRLALKNPTKEAIINPEEKKDYKNVIIQINSDKSEEGESKLRSDVNSGYQILHAAMSLS